MVLLRVAVLDRFYCTQKDKQDDSVEYPKHILLRSVDQKMVKIICSNFWLIGSITSQLIKLTPNMLSKTSVSVRGHL